MANIFARLQNVDSRTNGIAEAGLAAASNIGLTVERYLKVPVSCFGAAIPLDGLVIDFTLQTIIGPDGTSTLLVSGAEAAHYAGLVGLAVNDAWDQFIIDARAHPQYVDAGLFNVTLHGPLDPNRRPFGVTVADWHTFIGADHTTVPNTTPGPAVSVDQLNADMRNHAYVVRRNPDSNRGSLGVLNLPPGPAAVGAWDLYYFQHTGVTGQPATNVSGAHVEPWNHLNWDDNSTRHFCAANYLASADAAFRPLHIITRMAILRENHVNEEVMWVENPGDTSMIDQAFADEVIRLNDMFAGHTMAYSSAIIIWAMNHHVGQDAIPPFLKQFIERTVGVNIPTPGVAGAAIGSQRPWIEWIRDAVHPINTRLALACCKKAPIIATFYPCFGFPNKVKPDASFVLRADGPPAGMHRVANSWQCARALRGGGYLALMPSIDQFDTLRNLHGRMTLDPVLYHQASGWLLEFSRRLGYYTAAAPTDQNDAGLVGIMSELAYAALRLCGRSIGSSPAIKSIAQNAEQTWQDICNAIKAQRDALANVGAVIELLAHVPLSTGSPWLTISNAAISNQAKDIIGQILSSYNEWLVTRVLPTPPYHVAFLRDPTHMLQVPGANPFPSVDLLIATAGAIVVDM